MKYCNKKKAHVLKSFNPHFIYLYDHETTFYYLTSLGTEIPTVL